jgi:hypothetical protein
LIDEHGAGVVRLAPAYERNTASRDDLVQEIALALWWTEVPTVPVDLPRRVRRQSMWMRMHAAGELDKSR